MSSDPVLTHSNSVAVVTGGSRGIGLAIASALAGLGFAVVITGRDKERLDRSSVELRSLGFKCEGIVCDVTNLMSVTELGTQLREM
jgi:gluconate 5-dehydrogenase